MPEKSHEQTGGETGRPLPDHTTPHSATLSREELQQRARRHLAEADATNAHARRQRRRPPLWRILLWAVELAVLLAVVEIVFLNDRRDDADPPPAEPYRTLKYAGGETVPALGDKARELPGLTEVSPQSLAPLKGLAEGSKTMRRTQADYSTKSRLPIDVVNSIGMRFRLIPPGTALIGSPENEAGRGDGETQHVVTIPRPFYLGSCEVTQQQWNSIMPQNPSAFNGEQRPVEEVTWHDCQRFVKALCERENLPRRSYRLPTESEWEYACRAGTSSAYCCGQDADCLDPFAEFAENNYEGTRPVGRKRPNSLGLFNMHGNVWEWCQDRFAPYPSTLEPDQGEDLGQWRCIRGGNWYVPALDCRSAERSRLPPRSHGNMLGFRVLRTIP